MKIGAVHYLLIFANIAIISFPFWIAPLAKQLLGETDVQIIEREKVACLKYSIDIYVVYEELNFFEQTEGIVTVDMVNTLIDAISKIPMEPYQQCLNNIKASNGLDSWGNNYQYSIASQSDSQFVYLVYSLGPDGEDSSYRTPSDNIYEVVVIPKTETKQGSDDYLDKLP